MSQATTCTPGHGTARGAASSHGKVVIPAPSATVTWRHQRGDRIFAMRETADEQLKRVRRERESHPEKTERTMRRGQLLVRFAREGRLRDIDHAVSRCPKEEMLMWFAVRMFKEACLHNRLQIICFMVNHGLDVEFHAVLEAVHWLVDGCDEGRDGTDVVPGLNYLVEEAGMPPDTQRNSDFRTPLHLATERGLFEAARRLVELGADINAVAKDDVMPLTLAEQGLQADGHDETTNDFSSNTATTTPKTDHSSTQGAALSVTIPPPPPLPPPSTSPGDSGSGEAKKVDKERIRLSDEHGKEGVARADEGSRSTSSTSRSPSTFCLSPPDRQRRVVAGRARICGLLVERGARRVWRRAPSEQQANLDEKYAALLKDDDGRSFCTFSG